MQDISLTNEQIIEKNCMVSKNSNKSQLSNRCGLMNEEKRSNIEMIDLGSLFRNSATITFVIEILSVIIMFGAIIGHFLIGFLPDFGPDIQVLVILIVIIIILFVFLAALGVFVRFSRRIGDAVIGPGIQEVRMDTPRVKLVVYIYALLVIVMGILSIWLFWLVYNYVLAPAAGTSIALQIFNLALGAFFISILIQLIIAIVGRTATKVIIEVLDADDSEFLE